MTWQKKTLIIGALLGAVAGLAAALLYIRSIEDTGAQAPEKISTGSALKIGLSVFSLIREVANLGS